MQFTSNTFCNVLKVASAECKQGPDVIKASKKQSHSEN